MTETQDVSLNGRIVTLDGLALEVMRAMDQQRHAEVKDAFDRGYEGGRKWGEEERAKLAETVNCYQRAMDAISVALSDAKTWRILNR